MRLRKILIDARWYGLEQRGIGRYVKELIDGLVQYRDQFEIVLIVSQSNNSLTPSCFKKIVAKARWYSLAEQWEIPWIIEKVKPDLFHATHINVPLLMLVPYIITVHDLQLLKISDQRSTTLAKPIYYLKIFLAKLLIKRAIKNADKIIAVSKFTALEIISSVKIDEKKIQVIHEGVSFMPQSNYRPNLLLSLGINKPYFVYCGAAYPHKNLEKLIKAFIEFNTNNSRRWQLVLVGRSDYFYQRLQNQTKDPDVIFSGYLPDSDLSHVYRNCFCFVIASAYEGFGLTPLEAQSCGAPVLSARASSLPEVLAESALYFSPNDVSKISNAMSAITQNLELRQKLVRLGKINVTRFSWPVMVLSTIDLYR
jgi:glycosyltransferase involved in cell wall biosynthesis